MSHYKSVLSIDRHMRLANILKDAYDEVYKLLSDLLHDPDSNEHLGRKTNDALVYINKLQTALEYDLKLSVPDDEDPYDFKKRAYYGKERFYYSPSCEPNAEEPDAFAFWHVR